MNLSDRQFGTLHKKLTDPNEGGFSVNARGKSPSVGYMVSIPGSEMQVRSENVAPAHIKEFVEKHANELSKPGAHLGGWNNQASGEVSLDVSQNIKSKPSEVRQYGRSVADANAYTTASDLAIARNQEAGWDVKRGKEIPNPGFDPSRRR